MTDPCSKEAFDALKKSGRLGLAKARYLSVFLKFDKTPMSHKDATNLVHHQFGVKYPDRNGRISELETEGFIRKVGRVLQEGGGSTPVNLYSWTGRMTPIETEQKWVQCDHCHGKGKLSVARPVDQKQGDFVR